MKLILNMVSRGRHVMMIETLKKTLSVIEHPETEIVVSIDNDDEPSQDALVKANLGVLINRRAREDSLGTKYNRACEIPADLYMPIVDHTIPLTKGFDKVIIAAAERFPDGICAVHTHMANASFAAYNAISRRWIDIVGHMYEDFFPFWFVDHWTDDVARMIGRIAYADVHCDWSRKPFTAEMREPGWWATWFDAAYPMRRRQAIKLLEAMNIPLSEKENRITGFAWHEVRSRFINNSVRQIDKELTAYSKNSLTDPRYQRLKQRAVDMVPALLKALPEKEAATYRTMLTPPTTVPNLQRAFA